MQSECEIIKALLKHVKEESTMAVGWGCGGVKGQWEQNASNAAEL